MTPATLRHAIAEAERFLRIARQVPLREELFDGTKLAMMNVPADNAFGTSKHSAAAKRASMDLTRALAELRARR